MSCTLEAQYFFYGLLQHVPFLWESGTNDSQILCVRRDQTLLNYWKRALQTGWPPNLHVMKMLVWRYLVLRYPDLEKCPLEG